MDVDPQFDAFVRSRWAGLVRSAYLLTGDPHTAEDLAQDVLLRVAEHWHRIDGAPDAYTRRTLYTRWVDQWRWRRRQPDPVPELGHTAYGTRDGTSPQSRSTSPYAADPAGPSTARLTLLAALRTLTRRQQAVLVLRFYEDLTEAQCADALGISFNTVKSVTRQSLARLRDRFPELAETFGRTEVTR